MNSVHEPGSRTMSKILTQEKYRVNPSRKQAKCTEYTALASPSAQTARPAPRPRAPRAPRAPAAARPLLPHARSPRAFARLLPTRPCPALQRRSCRAPALPAPTSAYRLRAHLRACCAPTCAPRAPSLAPTCAPRAPSLAPCRRCSGCIAIQHCPCLLPSHNTVCITIQTYCPLNCIAIQFPPRLATSIAIHSSVLQPNFNPSSFLLCNTI